MNPDPKHGKVPQVGPDVAEYIDRFLEAKTAANTRRAYRCALLEFLDGARGMEDLVKVQPDEIVAHRNNLRAAGAEPTTVNARLCAIRGFFRSLKARGIVQNNPAEAELVPGYRVTDVSKANGLTPEELRALLATCDDSLMGLRDRAILHVGVIEGLRRSEISALNLDSIQKDGEHRILVLRDTKGGHMAKIKLDARVYDAIQDYLAARGGQLNPRDPIFVSCSRNGSRACRLSAESVNDIIQRHAARAGLAKIITAHSMRHTNATLSIDAGAPVQKVQRQLRHKDPKTTMRYYRNMDDLRKAGSDYVSW